MSRQYSTPQKKSNYWVNNNVEPQRGPGVWTVHRSYDTSEGREFVSREDSFVDFGECKNVGMKPPHKAVNQIILVKDFALKS